MNKKWLAAGMVAVVLAIASYFGYQNHQEKTVAEAVKPQVKLAAIYLKQFIELELNPTSMTFGEYFTKSKDAIGELDKKTVELESQATESHKAIYDEAITNIKTTQDLLRVLAAYTRGTMELNSGDANTNRLKAELAAANSSYEAQYLRKALLKQINENIETLDKRGKHLKELETLTKSYSKQFTELEKRYGNIGLEKEQLEKFAKLYVDEAPEKTEVSLKEGAGK